jgi:3-hydroxypropionate dehydrogenase (NADP+)
MDNINNVACIGAGLIGQGWATVFSAAGYALKLYDSDAAVLDKALERIQSNLEFLEANKLLKIAQTQAALKRIEAGRNFAEAVSEADYVQEAVYDNYEVKKKVFEQLDVRAPQKAILASSSSGLLMTEIQKAVKRPERCVLAHPFLPVHLLPLVEVVGGAQTSSETIATTVDLMEKIGKTPVILKKEVSGYIVNRLQAALLREAMDLVVSGVADAEQVDKAFCTSAGLRAPLIGPLLRAYLAGDGMERFIENYAQSYHIRWDSMATWNAISEPAAEAVIKSVNEMQLVRTKSLDEIKTWRDEMLIDILQVIRKASQVKV